ncbi:8-oxo-dGTP diphosphatase MutT [Candidatus Woesearchaeota archaeon]|nr:8-oxo-dGTP diphosphatase MutT [Candidatus Woesearchaeota archaeon]
MKKTVVVSAGIIRDAGKILITQRRPSCGVAPLLWEFPGGKIELDETPQNCLVREIKEEIGIEIESEELFDVFSFAYPEQLHVILIVYFAKKLSGVEQLLDIQDFRWVSIAEFNNFEFAPADVEIVHKLQSLQ